MRKMTILMALLMACGGKTAADYQTEASAALKAKNYPEAISVVEKGLAEDSVKKDTKGAWQLEQLRLEAMCKNKQGAAVVKELDRLAGTNAQQVTAALYRKLANDAKEAGDTPGAIDILAAGDQKFPAEHESFVKEIDALKAGGDLAPEEIERLKALGYL